MSLKIKPVLQKSPFVMNKYKPEVDKAFFKFKDHFILNHQ